MAHSEMRVGTDLVALKVLNVRELGNFALLAQFVIAIYIR